MTPYASSITSVLSNQIGQSQRALSDTLAEHSRVSSLDALGAEAVNLATFVRGYCHINKPEIDTDDEILNWVFDEALTDIGSAIWMLASGYYKASASCLRNGYDVAIHALSLQIRQNEHVGDGYVEKFERWDSGEIDTPGFGSLLGVVQKQKSVKKFDHGQEKSLRDVIYAHFSLLCGYTHSRAYTSAPTEAVNSPVTSINMGLETPEFDARYFERGCDLVATTISLLAVAWQVVFPDIKGTNPFGGSGIPSSLFLGELGKRALAHTNP